MLLKSPRPRRDHESIHLHRPRHSQQTTAIQRKSLQIRADPEGSTRPPYLEEGVAMFSADSQIWPGLGTALAANRAWWGWGSGRGFWREHDGLRRRGERRRPWEARPGIF
jgi:hypothetical protein